MTKSSFGLSGIERASSKGANMPGRPGIWTGNDEVLAENEEFAIPVIFSIAVGCRKYSCVILHT